MKQNKEINKTKKHLNCIAGIFIVLLLIALGTGFFNFYRIDVPQTSGYLVELGERLSENPEDYATGTRFALEHTDLSFENVDYGHVGSYEFTIRHAWQNFTCTVEVRDTTSPTLVLRSDEIVLLQGESYDTDTFVESAWDLGGDVSVGIFNLLTGECTDSFEALYLGKKNVLVQAEDPSGNITQEKKSVIVDLPPEFGDFPEYYIAVGSKVDFMEYITAYDKVDGDVTDSIRMDLSDMDLSKEGIGTVHFSVTDSYGLTAESEMRVRVCSRDNLQKLINNRSINRLNQVIIGAYNLYDGGVYSKNDVDYVMEQLQPAMVKLRVLRSSGSGFIAEITEDEIIVCTNYHVVGDADKVGVYFYDGTRKSGVVLGRTGYVSSEKDLALVSIKRKDISESLFDTLKTIHFNMGYWESLEQSGGTKVGMRCINERGGIWVDKRGTILRKEVRPEYYERYGVFTETSLELEKGMSGSALVDGYGNLVGMAVSTTTLDGEKHYWCITLKHIAECYKEITGRLPYYE